MTRTLLAVLACCLATGAARAETLSPCTALQASLGAVTVNVYYQPTEAGYEVVTTASAAAEDSVIRFVTTLAAGQSALVSVPRGAGVPALELQFRRIGDQLELQRPVS